MKNHPIHPASKEIAAELARTQSSLNESERKLRQSEAALSEEAAQRQALQGALHASEEMYHVAFDLAAVGMACVNADGRLFRVNEKYCEITGYSRAELLGMPVLNLTHPEDRKKERREFGTYLNGEQTEFSSEKRYLRKDGAVRWVSVVAHRIHDAEGRHCYSIGTIEDITERKQADEHLRQLLQQLKFHVENSPLAVIEFDTDLRIIRWSPAAERVFGWCAEEVLGKGMFEIPWVHVEDLAQIHNVAEELRSGHDPRNVTPNRNYRKDGRVINCEWYNSSLQDANGKLVSILSLVLDVTDRTNAKQLLQLQTQQLETFVRERTAKLKESIDELHQISYALVHDMRAPLRAMQSFAELVEGECTGCTRANTHEYHRRIIAATERLDRLVTDAFHYTKTLHQDVRIAPVKLDTLVRGLLQTYPDLLPDRADIRIEGTLPVVLGNEAFLTQCFSNLLGNSVKFVTAGTRPKIRVWAEAAPGQYASKPASGLEESMPSIQAPLTGFRIWIEDNGIGIPHDVQSRLFGMFQRFNPHYEGTGIGLAIVRKVVERMGGKVGVESEEGKGSRFWVDLQTPAQPNP